MCKIMLMKRENRYNAPHLVLDIGNTKVGGAVFEGDKILSKFRFKRGADWHDYLGERVAACGTLSGALVSSVVPALNSQVIKILKDQGVNPLLASDGKIPIGNKGHGVGSDRLADACGAVKLHGENVIAVSVGTALVFNVIKEAVFCGGVICPGMGMGVRALAEHCAMLPLVDVERPERICSLETIGNIQSGAYYGFVGTIERIVSGLQRECFSDKKAIVIMTGGVFSRNRGEPTELGEQLEGDLRGVIDSLEIDLTVIGLNEIFKHNI